MVRPSPPKPGLLARRPTLQSAASKSSAAADLEIEKYRKVYLEALEDPGPESGPANNASFTLGNLYARKGDYEKALTYLQQAHKGHEKNLGADKLSTLKATYAIARVYADKKEYDDALKWYNKVLGGKERLMGKNHKDVFDIMLDIAGVHGKMGNHQKALDFYEKTLAGQNATLENGDPAILETTKAVAECNAVLKKYGKAAEHYDAILKEDAGLLRDAATYNHFRDIANFYKAQKPPQYDAALKYAKRALSGHEKTARKGSPPPVEMMRTVAAICTGMRLDDDAIDYYGRALRASEKLNGSDHTNSVNIAHNLAQVYKRKQQYASALQLYGKAAVGYSKQSVEAGQKLATEMVCTMATVYPKQKSREFDRAHFERVLKAIGKLPDEVLGALNTMAGELEGKKDVDEAMHWYARVLNSYESEPGKQNAPALETFTAMAKLYPALALKSEKAEQVFVAALRFFDTNCPAAVPNALHEIAKTIKDGSKGGSSKSTRDGRREQKAVEWFKRTVSYYKMVEGDKHKTTIREIYSEMAALYQKLDDVELSFAYLERSLAAFDDSREKGSEAHLAVINSLSTGAATFKKNNDFEQCLRWYSRALSASITASGKDNETVHEIFGNMAGLFPLNLKKPEKCNQHFERSVESFDGALSTSELSALHQMATRYFAQQRYSEAHHWLKRILTAFESSAQKGSEAHLESLDYLVARAGEFKKNRDGNRQTLERSLAWYTTALSAAQKIDEKHSRVLSINYDMATLSYTSGDYEGALKLLKTLSGGDAPAKGMFKSFLSGSDTPDKDTADLRKKACAFLFAKARELRQNRVVKTKVYEWYTAALEGFEKLDMKPEIMATTYCMASLHRDKPDRDMDKALELFEKIVSDCTGDVLEKAADTYVATLAAMVSIGADYNARDHERALSLFERVLTGCDALPAKTQDLYLDILDTMYRTGNSFIAKSETDSALDLFNRLFQRCAKYPDVTTELNNKALGGIVRVANLYRTQDDYTKAMELFNQVLAASEKTSEAHKAALQSVYNAGTSLRSAKDYAKAQTWFARALKGYEESVGATHTDTLRTISKIAGTHKDQGNLNKARDWYNRALAGYTEHHPAHVELPKTHSQLASIYLVQSNHAKALEHYAAALPGYESLGPVHPDTLKTVHHMASVYLQQNNLDEAFEYFRRAKSGWQRNEGDKARREATAATEGIAAVLKAMVDNAASLAGKRGKQEEALEVYEKAKSYSHKAFGRASKEHTAALEGISAILQKMTDEAAALAKKGKNDAALEAYEKAKTTCAKGLGRSSKEYRSIQAAIDGIQATIGAKNAPPEPAPQPEPSSKPPTPKAHKRDRDRQTSHKSARSPSPPPTTDYLPLERIALAHTAQKSYAAALTTYATLLPLKSSTLGPTSPDFLKTLETVASLYKKNSQYRESFTHYNLALNGHIALNEPKSITKTLKKLTSLLPRTVESSGELEAAVQKARKLNALGDRAVKGLASMARKLEHKAGPQVALPWWQMVLREREEGTAEWCDCLAGVARCEEGDRAVKNWKKAASGYAKLGMEREKGECEMKAKRVGKGKERKAEGKKLKVRSEVKEVTPEDRKLEERRKRREKRGEEGEEDRGRRRMQRRKKAV